MEQKRIFKIGAVTLAAALGFAALVPAFAASDADRAMGNGPAAHFLSMDANGDGKVTAEEIDAFRAEQFKTADTDGDGFLSKDELLAAAMTRMQERMAQRIDKMIAHDDKDGDGKISLAEQDGNPRMDRMFSRLDKDGDGALSTEELAAIGEHGWHKGKKHHNDNE